MKQSRRLGVENSATRTQFIDAAEEILSTEGYSGISARQVAAKAGLKTQLLYYYFLTMDDLILAVVRRLNERRRQRFEEALAQPDPLRAMWEQYSDPASAALSVQLTSIASQREAVRAEIVRAAQAFRALQIETVSRLLKDRNEPQYPAAGLVMIAVALSRTLLTESTLGLTEGHREAVMIVERVLQDLAPKTAVTPPVVTQKKKPARKA